MKKILLAIMLVAAVAVNAQGFKPEVGKFGVEVAVSGLTDVGLQGGKLVGTYSFTDAIGVRLGLGIQSVGTKFDNGEANASKMLLEGSSSGFIIAPGLVYSFAGTERLTPYVGAEITFSSTSNKSTTTLGTTETITENANNPYSKFGFNVFAGFNYYIAKNLYLGAECGLGLASTSYKNEKVTGVAESKFERSESTFGVNVTPALRLGWSF